MNMTFKIDIDRRKVEAIRCYMPDGNIEELLNEEITKAAENVVNRLYSCLLYTSDAADEL